MFIEPRSRIYNILVDIIIAYIWFLYLSMLSMLYTFTVYRVSRTLTIFVFLIRQHSHIPTVRQTKKKCDKYVWKRGTEQQQPRANHNIKVLQESIPWIELKTGRCTQKRTNTKKKNIVTHWCWCGCCCCYRSTLEEALFCVTAPKWNISFICRCLFQRFQFSFTILFVILCFCCFVAFRLISLSYYTLRALI